MFTLLIQHFNTRQTSAVYLLIVVWAANTIGLKVNTTGLCVCVFGVISVLVTCVCGAGILWH